jgi:hypothetical protein
MLLKKIIHYNQLYCARTLWAKYYSSEKLDDITSVLVTIGTLCPEWTYVNKDDDTYCAMRRIMLYYDHLRLYLTDYSQ